MIVCGCHNLMHTAGVDEQADSAGSSPWLVRLECRRCGFQTGADGPADEVIHLVDRLMWTDDARHVLDRMPPYAAPLVKYEAEEFARAHGQRVITFAVLAQARQGATVVWDPVAERRLNKVPAPVRAMARVELERAAVERGESQVTVLLMEEVKARYFGLFGSK
ncbi:MAG TPA: PCP reductase family protein [Nitrospiraceae bacterium]|nr:PCP reductase family protein [Nitrospiraceae bacterium]